METIARKKRLTALVVSDNSDTREMYTVFLSRQGVNTVEADDGFHGLAKASTIVPDVITTDIHLPGMTGIEFCASLKQQERTKEIPVIGVTGSVSQSEIEAAKKAGCISVLRKPCLPEALLAEIHRVLALPSKPGASK